MCFGCLGLAQILKGTVVAVFPLFLPYFFGAQFFGSTIQGSISDIYKRSTILNISLSVIILTLSLLVFSYSWDHYLSIFIQFVCICLIGLAGNADVVSRASIVDIYYHTDRRKVMSWTGFAEAFSWVIVGVLIRYLRFEPFNILIACIFISVCMLILSVLFNTDKTQDKNHLHEVKNEFMLVLKNHKKKLLSISAIVFAGELAYFFFFYNQEEHLSSKVLADSYIAWFLGMSVGCWILSKLKRSSDFFYLMAGGAISLISINLFTVNGMQRISNPNAFFFDSFVFGLAGFGSGIYLPCFYSLISRGYSVHFQGILMGWIDSLQISITARGKIVITKILSNQ
jgi:MFS family permease